VRGERSAERRGGIVPIAVREPKAVVDALAAERIIVDYRPGVVRCSPAFYNTEDEVRLLVDRLAALVPSSDRAEA
jgi:kynureninase